MIANSTENLHALGQVWLSWGGVWSPRDEVHFEFPGFQPPAVSDDLPSDDQGIPWWVDLPGVFIPAAGVEESPDEAIRAKLCSWGWKSLCKA
jgi:hypothetical protein